jgi:signal transduction histidine kinase
LAQRFTEFDRRQSIRHQRETPDGRVVEVNSDPTPDGGFVITHTDVTALVQARAEAQQRASILGIMLDNLRHGISLFDSEGRLVAANRLAAQLNGFPGDGSRIGYRLGELLGELLDRGLLTADRAATQLALDRRQSHRMVHRLPSGTVLEVRSDPTPDGGFVITYSDVTELTQAQTEASDRADVLRAMLDNIRNGVCLFDAEGKVVGGNAVLRQILRLPEEAVAPGITVYDYIDNLRKYGAYGEGPAAEATATAMKLRFDAATPARAERRMPDGRTLEVVSDPMPQGGFLLGYTDITEDRRIRTELEQAKEAAEAANRTKSRFLATMSHELRTPLNAVIGFSEAIMANPDPTAVREYIQPVHEAGRHLLSLIDDILDVARAETIGVQIAEAEVDLADLAQSSVRVMRAVAEAARVTLGLALQPGLPLVRADELRLRQVLLNLLSNAVKFTPAGGKVTLHAGLGPEGDLVVRVIDTGIGIKAEDIPRAFEPFSQLDSSHSRRFPGSGLGLYLSRALAEAQGAELGLESADGGGTCAVLRFPPGRLLPAAPRA